MRLGLAGRPRAGCSVQSGRPVTQPGEALWHTGGPLLASLAVGWFLLGIAAGAVLAALFLAVWSRSRRPTAVSSSRSASRTGGDPEEVAATFLERVGDLPGVEAAAIVLVDADARRAEGLRAESDGREIPSFRGIVFDLQHEPSGIATAVFEAAPYTEFDASSARVNRELVDALDAKSIAYVPLDVRDDDRFERSFRDALARAGAHALLAVPVAGGHANESGLALVFFDGPRTFPDEDLELAGHLADAARGALARGDLLEAERTARTLSQQLARTGSVLATELDPAAILDEVVEQARALLGTDACAIRTAEEDELVVSAAAGDGIDAAIGARSPSGAWLSGDVYQSRAPVAIEDASGDDRLLAADPVLAAGYSAFLGVPLAGPDAAIHGVLAVYTRRARAWRPEETDALLALAANTSAALSNAELYSRVLLEKERSLAILANVADGIVAVDRDGEVVLWNAAAEIITGVPAEEALGRTPVQVLQRTLESDDARGPRLVSIMRGGAEVWLPLSEAVMAAPLGGVA